MYKIIKEGQAVDIKKMISGTQGELGMRSVSWKLVKGVRREEGGRQTGRGSDYSRVYV